MAAGDIEEPVGAALADAGQVGHRDSEEVQHIADRGAVEIAVRFHPSVERDDGIVHGAGQFAARDGAGVLGGVARGTGDLGRTAQRVRVLHQRAVGPAVARDYR